MESEEKGGKEREATPQSAAAASSPYTGEPETATRFAAAGQSGAFCLIRGGTGRLGERRRRLW